MGYFRAILKSEEVSDRAFTLTQEVIKHSAGNYSAWWYRRKMIDDQKLELADEMEWLRAIGMEMEKNY